VSSVEEDGAAAIGTPIDYEKEGAAAAERGIAPSSPLAGSGWIVANFPVNIVQGRLLEYLLAGDSAASDAELDGLISAVAVAGGTKGGKGKGSTAKGDNGAAANADTALGELLVDDPLHVSANIDGILFLKFLGELEAYDLAPVPVIDAFGTRSKAAQVPSPFTAGSSSDEQTGSKSKAWWAQFLDGAIGSSVELRRSTSTSAGTAVVKFGLAAETIEVAFEAAGERSTLLERWAKRRLAERITACMEYRDAVAAVATANASKGKGDEKVPEPPIPPLVSDPIAIQHASTSGDDAESNVANPCPPPLLDAARLEDRRQRRRKLLPVVGQLWQSLRCGEHSMQARAVRGPIKDWNESSHAYVDALQRACLEILKIERSIDDFAALSRWNTACAVRSSRGDSSPHLVAVARENLLRGKSPNPTE
jgi:hypothetical protein